MNENSKTVRNQSANFVPAMLVGSNVVVEQDMELKSQHRSCFATWCDGCNDCTHGPTYTDALADNS